jgi:hypothetical protein
MKSEKERDFNTFLISRGWQENSVVGGIANYVYELSASS